jgi:hypothetical protein
MGWACSEMRNTQGIFVRRYEKKNYLKIVFVCEKIINITVDC